MDQREEEYKFFTGLKAELKAAAEKLEKEIEDEKGTIKEFKAYINEHYAEMDEKELRENVDSAGNMARLAQADLERLRSLGFMQENPYFARLDYIPDGQDEITELRFGGAGFWSEKDKKVKLFDWRAPVAALYYDHELGRATYSVPDPDSQRGERISYGGEIKRRIQTVIKNGELVSAAETDLRLNDELLIEVLSGNAPEKMRPVIATIQKEQNDIIRDDESSVLVVDGRAGSGKTVIAMHRIAWLLYNKKRLSSDDMLILSPNSIFTDYISRILPELNENPVPEKQWDDFISEIVLVDADAESKAEQAEALRTGGNSERMESVKKKSSLAFYLAMEKYFENYFTDGMSFKDFHYEKTTFPKEKLERMFFKNFQALPPYERFHNIAYFIMDDYLLLSKRNFTEGRQEKIQGQIRDLLIRQFAEIDLTEFYRGFLSSIKNEPFSAEITFTEDGRLSYEDMQVLLWLQVKLYGVKTYFGVKHLTVDEMQDYSVFQLAVIKELFKGSISFYGDRFQLLYDTEPVTEAIKMLWPSVRIRELTKSYRSTAEICEYCNSLLTGDVKAEAVSRHGSRPEEISFTEGDYEKLAEELEMRLKKLEKKGYGSISILCENEEEAYAVFRSLKENGRELSFLSEQNAGYHGGICVTSAFLSKGMEFDAVLVVCPLSKKELFEKKDRSLMYVACTRALHELYIFYSDRESRE